ncbi:hypothetical protein B0H63DRAFT_489980 [Podospora didyma]|uniref:Uncharacterized protein n=1 Tax=Podospora didyma TaxID=330526 RepID=A0AAE0K1D5_9PEZI|nr:hypothetical protein B0H63DRAFT_489980 [Podospora didyma]
MKCPSPAPWFQVLHAQRMITMTNAKAPPSVPTKMPIGSLLEVFAGGGGGGWEDGPSGADVVPVNGSVDLPVAVMGGVLTGPVGIGVGVDFRGSVTTSPEQTASYLWKLTDTEKPREIGDKRSASSRVRSPGPGYEFRKRVLGQITIRENVPAVFVLQSTMNCAVPAALQAAAAEEARIYRSVQSGRGCQGLGAPRRRVEPAAGDGAHVGSLAVYLWSG